MNSDQFATLAASGYNRIPLVEELLADIDTPVSTYLKLAKGPHSFLLESVEGGETWGRYSIIGLPCSTTIRVSGNSITVSENRVVVETQECSQPLDFIEQFQQRYRVPEVPELPNFSGGLVGYFAYDTARYAEPRLSPRQETSTQEGELTTPDIVLMLAEEVLVFDNLAGTIKIIVHCDPTSPDAYASGTKRLAELKKQIRTAQLSVKEIDLSRRSAAATLTSSTPQADYESAVEKIKDYILAGDCMQVVLSQRLSGDFDGDSIDLYRALRLLNPSPYMYYLDLGDFDIVGSSPEVLARLEDDTVTVRPIAGTRRRGKTPVEDLALEEELMADPKELAEHLMLIDLGRNDIGRIAKTGSVQLEEQMIVERYSHVMHIVSRVSGQLHDEYSAYDVLQSCLPAGTLSGAPKIRAMEIIEELEPLKRGIYGGAIGYIGWKGEMDTAIAIRTAVIKDKKIYLQAGAGIVADSQPRLEWEECMNKAQAVIKAMQLCC